MDVDGTWRTVLAHGMAIPMGRGWQFECVLPSAEDVSASLASGKWHPQQPLILGPGKWQASQGKREQPLSLGPSKWQAWQGKREEKDKGKRMRSEQEKSKGKVRLWMPSEQAALIDKNGLQAGNAKQRKQLRNQFRLLRAPGERKGAYGPKALAPPPPICNRVGACQWGSPGSGCRCDEWPQWITQYGLPCGRAVVVDIVAGNLSRDPAAANIQV